MLRKSAEVPPASNPRIHAMGTQAFAPSGPTHLDLVVHAVRKIYAPHVLHQQLQGRAGSGRHNDSGRRHTVRHALVYTVNEDLHAVPHAADNKRCPADGRRQRRRVQQKAVPAADRLGKRRRCGPRRCGLRRESGEVLQ